MLFAAYVVEATHDRFHTLPIRLVSVSASADEEALQAMTLSILTVIAPGSVIAYSAIDATAELRFVARSKVSGTQALVLGIAGIAIVCTAVTPAASEHRRSSSMPVVTASEFRNQNDTCW